MKQIDILIRKNKTSVQTKVNSNWTKDPKANRRIIILLEENIGQYFYDFKANKNLLNNTKIMYHKGKKLMN
jgi:hypothetical protein